MWIIQESKKIQSQTANENESNKLELWKKLHFEEEKTESIYHV